MVEGKEVTGVCVWHLPVPCKRSKVNADINVNERLIEMKVKMSWDNNLDRQTQAKQQRLGIIIPS